MDPVQRLRQSAHFEGRPRTRSSASDFAGLFRRGHAGRHFGALWFKLFLERGPC